MSLATNKDERCLGDSFYINLCMFANCLHQVDSQRCIDILTNLRKAMMILEFSVDMDCPGCERKIKKALKKIDGVEDIEIDMAMQKVTVTGSADQEKVLKRIRKTGRQAELWSFAYNPEYNHQYLTSYYYLGQNQNHSADLDQHQNHSAAIYYVFEPSETYDYPVHGYLHGYRGDHDNSYYYQRPYSTILDEKASSIFSDENANACSIM